VKSQTPNGSVDKALPTDLDDKETIRWLRHRLIEVAQRRRELEDENRRLRRELVIWTQECERVQQALIRAQRKGHRKNTPPGTPHEAEQPIDAQTIVYTVCNLLSVHPDELASEKRTRPIVAARAIITALARQHTNLSFPEITRAMGKTAHSAVITLHHKTRDKIERGELLQKEVAEAAKLPPTATWNDLLELASLKIEKARNNENGPSDRF